MWFKLLHGRHTQADPNFTRQRSGRRSRFNRNTRSFGNEAVDPNARFEKWNDAQALAEADDGCWNGDVHAAEITHAASNVPGMVSNPVFEETNEIACRLLLQDTGKFQCLDNLSPSPGNERENSLLPMSAAEIERRNREQAAVGNRLYQQRSGRFAGNPPFTPLTSEQRAAEPAATFQHGVAKSLVVGTDSPGLLSRGHDTV